MANQKKLALVDLAASFERKIARIAKFKWQTDHVRFYVVDLTPKLAEELLAMRPEKIQRNINQEDVAKYVRDIDADRWQQNGEPVHVSGSMLVNGQHRCSACVQSGKTLRNTPIGFEVETPTVGGGELILSVDNGRTRTPEQHSRMYLGHSVSGTVLAAIKLESRNFMHGKGKLTRSEEVELYERCEHKQLLTSVVNACNTRGIINAATLGACLACARKRPEEAHKFFMALARREAAVDGVHVPQLQRLINSLFDSEQDRAKRRAGNHDAWMRELAYRTVYAFNGWITGSDKICKYTAGTEVPAVK